jgi:hypothetical protein
MKSIVLLIGLFLSNSTPVKNSEYLVTTEENWNLSVSDDDDIREYILDLDLIHRDNFKKLPDDILKLMRSQCDYWEIPYEVFFSLVDRESGFKFIPNKTGTGAFGYMQLMPGTFKSNAKMLGIEPINNKENNIKVGAYLLKKIHNRWLDRGYSNVEAWRFTIAEYQSPKTIRRVDESNWEISKNRIGNIDKILNNYYTSFTLDL